MTGQAQIEFFITDDENMPTITFSGFEHTEGEQGGVVGFDQLSTYTLALAAKLAACVPSVFDRRSIAPPASGTRYTCASIGESLPAITAMPLLQALAMTTIGSPAAAPSVAAAMPNMPKSTDLVTTAFLPSVGLSNGMTSTLKPAGVNFS